MTALDCAGRTQELSGPESGQQRSDQMKGALDKGENDADEAGRSLNLTRNRASYPGENVCVSERFIKWCRDILLLDELTNHQSMKWRLAGGAAKTAQRGVGDDTMTGIS